MPNISVYLLFTRAYAQTHVVKISVYKGFQWVLFVATDVDGSQYSDSLLESLKILRDFLI
jgi:hypothetical protein